jgi:hypothetical protein
MQASRLGVLLLSTVRLVQSIARIFAWQRIWQQLRQQAHRHEHTAQP